jgi:hypothetical protein
MPQKEINFSKARSKESIDRCCLGVSHSLSPKDVFLFKADRILTPLPAARPAPDKSGSYPSPLRLL